MAGFFYAQALAANETFSRLPADRGRFLGRFIRLMVTRYYAHFLCSENGRQQEYRGTVEMSMRTEDWKEAAKAIGRKFKEARDIQVLQWARVH